jgi:hypothetical protein
MSERHSDEELRDIIQYSEAILDASDARDVFPTPIDRIVECADLVVSGEIHLEPKQHGFFTKSLKVLQSALQKAKGIIDLREKVIYLDPTSTDGKKAFVKCHEVGHKVIPWQAKTLLYVDDEMTLDPEVKNRFEREANFFASEVLFQGDRFEREARDLPLEVKSAMYLAKRYGSSVHAALRRFVRTNHRSCALLVINYVDVKNRATTSLTLRSSDCSSAFLKTGGPVDWPNNLDLVCPATPDIRAGVRWGWGRWLLRTRDGRDCDCRYQLYTTSYNAFLLIYPTTTRTQTRTRIILPE